MIIIKRTVNGFELNKQISTNDFMPNKNAIVRVLCEQPYYGNDHQLADAICGFLTQELKNEVQVFTHHCLSNISTETYSNGDKVIKQLDFQALI